MGIILALEMAIDLQNDCPSRPVRLFADNHAAIRSSSNPQSGPCHFLRARILDIFRKLNSSLSIHWIPTHIGVSEMRQQARKPRQQLKWVLRWTELLATTSPCHTCYILFFQHLKHWQWRSGTALGIPENRSSTISYSNSARS